MTTTCWLILIFGFIVAMVIALVFARMCYQAKVYDDEFRQKWEEEHK